MHHSAWMGLYKILWPIVLTMWMMMLIFQLTSQKACIDKLRLRQNGHHFVDVFKCIFFIENVWISLMITQTFVPKVWINNIPALVEIMAWCQPGDKPVSQPIVVSLLMHICVTHLNELVSCTQTVGVKWTTFRTTFQQQAIYHLAPLKCFFFFKDSKFRVDKALLKMHPNRPSFDPLFFWYELQVYP